MEELSKRSESESGTRVRKTDIVPHSFTRVVICIMRDEMDKLIAPAGYG
jgi:hypothetical protein